MMIEGSLVTIVALAWLFLRLAQEGELRQELLERGPRPRAVRRCSTGARRSSPSAAENGSAMRSGVHHVDLVVSSIERSLPFYRELLGPLGYTRGEVEGERGETIWYSAVQAAPSASRGAERRQQRPLPDRASPRRLRASSRELVDERHDWLVEVGATIESPPQEYTYRPGYYAVFYDLDGIKLEIVNVPPPPTAA